MSATGDQRLDSWKAIATYLGRDVRTVRRWESEKGLPVRRVPGGAGHSVFAYSSEIEAWLKGPQGPDGEQTQVGAPAAASRQRWPRAGVLIAGVLLVLGLASLGWTLGAPVLRAEDLRVRINIDEIIAADPAGEVHWRHTFPRTELTALPTLTNFEAEVSAVLPPAVIAGTAHRIERATQRALSGQLFSFSLNGRLEWRFSFDDRLMFNGRPFGEPWCITRYWLDEQRGRRRIAVSAHHFQWWQGLVTVLDDHGRRGKTFVNSGWIEDLRWAGADRLIVSGFSDSRDGGVVALLDTDKLHGHSPEDPGTYFCDSCGPDLPIRYVVLPRSDLNRVTGSPFNRALIELTDDGVIAHTTEIPSSPGGEAISASYEFSRDLQIRRAHFDDRYWDLHRTLESQGKLQETVAQSRERGGPREIRVWEPGTGWRTIDLAGYR